MTPPTHPRIPTPHSRARPQEYTAALEQAKLALRLREAAHGGGAAVAVAAHLVQVGEAMAVTGAGTNEQKIDLFEKAKRIWDGEYGEGQHVATARCLVGIGIRYMTKGMGYKYQKALEYGREALAVVQRSGKGGGIEEARPLDLIGEAHWRLKQWDEALAHFQRQLRLLLDHHGEEGAKRVAEVAEAYRMVGVIYNDGKGDYERALEQYMKAVPVAEEATGKLSDTTGRLCHTIAIAYEGQQRWAESVPWWERAVAAYTFTYGAENEQYTKEAQKWLEEARREAAKQK